MIVPKLASMKKLALCKIEDCENPVNNRGWCIMHYRRWLRHGDPLIIKAVKNDGRMGHPYFSTHASMIKRCYSSNMKGYELYGGRGISVCDEWRGPFGFWQFVKDMGEKPAPSYGLDRIDPDGNYEPSNVRWASTTTQRLNTRKIGNPGVRFSKSRNKWEATITIKYKPIWLGYFDRKEDAIKAREDAEEMYHAPYLIVDKH
jgi:hypothetical protein